MKRSKKETLTISGKQNDKLSSEDPENNIFSVSLTRETCNKTLACYKLGYCYVAKGRFNYPSVRRAYTKNETIYKNNPSDFFLQLQEFFTDNNINYFRYHVSGDIPDYDYFCRIVRNSLLFPKIQFCLYTKKYFEREDDNYINDYCKKYGKESIPNNLHILYSSLENEPINNPYSFNVCWYQPKDKSEKRVSKNAIECTGYCPECLACYNVNKHHRDIVINHH